MKNLVKIINFLADEYDNIQVIEENEFFAKLAAENEYLEEKYTLTIETDENDEGEKYYVITQYNHNTKHTNDVTTIFESELV
jgi:hypothetical protein